MLNGFVRPSLIAALAIAFASQGSAQHPGPFQGAGWLVAYGGGSSLGGALGVTQAVVSPPLPLSTATDPFDDVADASSNGGHTLIARRNGSVWVMGANDRGQLGLGHAGPPIATLTQIQSLNDVVKVVVAGESSYAIDSAGTLWVWGDDSFGQLGIDNPGGASMQTAPVANSLINVSDVDAGPDFAVAATGDGRIWAWGANARAQLGAPGPDRSMPVLVAAPQDFFTIDVAAGGETAMARSFDRQVMGWGGNARRQIADDGDTVVAGTTIVSTDVISMGVGDQHIVMARADGTVQVRGANWAGQLGNGWNTAAAPGLYTVAGLAGVVEVAAGAAHSIAVTADGEAFGWGFNAMRQLLYPTPDVFSATPQRVMDVPLTARSVRAKSATTILLSDPGAVAVRMSAPDTVGCSEMFVASMSIRGFAASGGEPDQQFPGIHDLEVMLTVSPAFELAGAPTADAGAVTANDDSVTWSFESLDPSIVTLSVPLRARGTDGEHPLFSSISYVSSASPTQTHVRSTLAFHPACSAADVTPPVIASVTPSLASIKPPNRQMIPVTVDVVAHDEVSTPVCTVTGVTANESIDGDWQITGPLDVALRAERAGSGNGRIYQIAVACTDDAGNTSTASTTVTVPKGKKGP